MPLAGSEQLFVQNFKAAVVASGTPVTEPQFSQIWLAFTQTLFAHLAANILVNVQDGIPVATTGTAAAQTGATTAPGVGSII